MYAFASKAETTAEELSAAIMDAIASAVIDDDRRHGAVNRLRTAHAAELQKVNGVADSVAWSTLFWNDPAYVNGVLERYNNVATDAVRQICAACTDPSKIVRLDVVPRAGSDGA